MNKSQDRTDEYVDNIYKIVTEAYDAGDQDTMLCVLNEVAHLCAEYFQLKDGR